MTLIETRPAPIKADPYQIRLLQTIIRMSVHDCYRDYLNHYDLELWCWKAKTTKYVKWLAKVGVIEQRFDIVERNGQVYRITDEGVASALATVEAWEAAQS